MAKKSGIEIRQKDRMRFNKKMRKLSKFVKIGGGFDKELSIYATDIMLRSSLKVPVITGNLKQSVYVEKKPFNYEVGYKINYAPFVEYGKAGRGKFTGMKPFFRPSIMEATFAFIKRLRKQINKDTRT